MQLFCDCGHIYLLIFSARGERQVSQFAVGQTWDKKLNTKQTPGAPAAYRRRSESVAVSPFGMQLRLYIHIIALLLNLAVRNGHFVGKMLLTLFFLKFHLNDNS